MNSPREDKGPPKDRGQNELERDSDEDILGSALNAFSDYERRARKLRDSYERNLTKVENADAMELRDAFESDRWSLLKDLENRVLAGAARGQGGELGKDLAELGRELSKEREEHRREMDQARREAVREGKPEKFLEKRADLNRRYNDKMEQIWRRFYERHR